MVQDLENINEVPAKIIAQENGLKKQLQLLKTQLDEVYRKGIPIDSEKVTTLKKAIASTDRQIDSLLIICKKKYPKYSSI